MVASSSADLYSPFQHTMISEDGPQSSEGGSGLQSPIFGTSYPPTNTDGFRYQHNHLDIQHAAGIQFDYAQPLNTQQAPILDTTLELPNPSARHVTFASAHYTLPRNQLGIDFPVQSPVNSRFPPLAHGGGTVDYRFTTSSERRLPGGSSHEQPYPQPAQNSTIMPMEGDHRPPPVVATERSEHSSASSGAREPRKEISSPVVIACRPCRSRKIRCDSTRPACSNCLRRSNPCEYDAAPKRRGPDKHPGTRQRSCKKRPADGSAPPPTKRKKIAADHSPLARESSPSKVKENMEAQRSPSSSRHSERSHDGHPHAHHVHPTEAPPDLRISTNSAAIVRHETSPTYRRPPSYGYEQSPYINPSYPRQIDVNILQAPHPQSTHRKFPVPSSPAVETEQRVWWDKILKQFNPNVIIEEVKFLLANTGHMLSFIHVKFLFERLMNNDERLCIQPAFILAALAMSKLIKSSSVEESDDGLKRAMALRTDARTAFQDAWRTGWIDATLAEAALILALFESSAHPQYSHEEAASSLRHLDEIIRNIQLTTNDSNDPDVCTFAPNFVPVIIVDTGPEEDLRLHGGRQCSCVHRDLTSSPDPYSTRPYELPWDSSWSADKIRDEEIRRLCWSALGLVSSYSAQCAAFNRSPPSLYLSNPSNYALLFPGEVMDRLSPNYQSSASLSPKESIWALYCRSMLLWNFCNRFRHPSASIDNEEKAEHAQEAWLEAQALQDSLDMHHCNLDTTLIYMCREYIHNIRMLVTQALRSLQGLDSGPTTTPGPIFKRKQAEDWLYYQDQVIRRVNSTINHLNGQDGFQLTRRPFRVNWFLTQLAICLVLWNHDQTLHDALKLAKLIMPAVDVMNALWPSPVNQNQSDALRQQLADACRITGVEQPLPASYSIPAFIRTT